ncbi:hypothetical protein ADK76_29110 [Streptomyces griseoflavus]|uniref:hypothetical protein n=1 Tax=Streptomyces rimosus TaxID=1927 RepID=UPI000517F771|nr:hypothetical protein [Streptomyces rimosus]KOG53168.1 hypothetical protein ADK76_29110 [Streptomyces griseoflavus]
MPVSSQSRGGSAVVVVTFDFSSAVQPLTTWFPALAEDVQRYLRRLTDEPLDVQINARSELGAVYRGGHRLFAAFAYATYPVRRSVTA